MNKASVRVVVVEDSLVQRAHLVSALQADGDIQVVGEATTTSEALDAIERHRPDVVTVDLHIPEGGGQRVIEQVMARRPTPILVLSATVQNERSATAVEAVVGGALVAMPKPARWTAAHEADLRRKVRSLSRVPVIRHPRGLRRDPPSTPVPAVGPGRPIVAIAASTGGPAALATVLSNLTGLDAPVMIVQHLQADFVDGLAAWMARASPLPVEIAKNGQVLVPGHVYIGPGDVHLRLAPGRRIELSRLPESLHRPSADELFNSVAQQAGADGIGVILSGMGDDGAQGLLALSLRGGRTIGQDEASCAVFGMPAAAARMGAVTQLLPPEEIGAVIRRLVSGARA